MEGKSLYTIFLVCLVTQVFHAIPALEAGQIIFEPYSFSAFAMPGLQLTLGFTTFLYHRKHLAPRPKHRKKIDTVCVWSGIYIGLLTVLEVCFVAFGSPFGHQTNELIAHLSMAISCIVITNLYEKLNPIKQHTRALKGSSQKALTKIVSNPIKKLPTDKTQNGESRERRKLAVGKRKLTGNLGQKQEDDMV